MVNTPATSRQSERGLPAVARPVTFAGDGWLAYVPVRLPDTICVEEKLPPGAAAVLINRAHTHRDIYLPINTQEKRAYGRECVVLANRRP
jgi:hypothetical protein